MWVICSRNIIGNAVSKSPESATLLQKDYCRRYAMRAASFRCEQHEFSDAAHRSSINTNSPLKAIRSSTADRRSRVRRATMPGPAAPRSGRALDASDPEGGRFRRRAGSGRLRARASGARFHDFRLLLNNFTVLQSHGKSQHRRAQAVDGAKTSASPSRYVRLPCH